MSERLDCYLVNSSWWHLFPNAGVTHGLAAYSDHVPIWVDLEGLEVLPRSKKLFKFEAMWAGEKDFKAIIHNVWGKLFITS